MVYQNQPLYTVTVGANTICIMKHTRLNNDEVYTVLVQYTVDSSRMRIYTVTKALIFFRAKTVIGYDVLTTFKI